MWRSGQIKLAAEAGQGGKQLRTLPLIATGREALHNAPLSPSGLWFIGLGREARGDLPGARSAFAMAERVSRREGRVQIWLGVDDLKRSRIASGLHHFDIVLRTTPAAQQEILPQLALATLAPEGRAALKPYMRTSNPWLPNFLAVAVDRLPRVETLGLLLSEPGVQLPRGAMARDAYATLVRRLTAEHSYDVFRRVYPLLPGADAKSLNGLGLEYLAGLGRGYPPAIWDFGMSSDRGGAPITVDKDKIGLEFFAAPGTVGVAGSKLMAPGERRTLEWTIVDRTPNKDATARWIATCVDERGAGVSSSSNDMMEVLPIGRRLRLDMPPGCAMVRLDLRFAGGTGRQPANLVVGDLALVAAPGREAR